MDFALITALDEEREALLSKLPDAQKLAPDGRDVHVYYAASIQTRTGATYNLRVTSLGEMGPIRAASTVKDVVHRWNPAYVLLVGIAGGLAEHTRPGDVLIASGIADYTLGKQRPDGTREVRWIQFPLDSALFNAASNFSTGWEDLIAVERPDKRGAPSRRKGVIVSGGDVIAFPDLVRTYQATWPKLIGIEMEGGGVALALHETLERPRFLMVRGVSDLADGENNTRTKKRWRDYACHVAAAYAVGLLRDGPVASPPPPEDPWIARVAEHRARVTRKRMGRVGRASGVEAILTNPEAIFIDQACAVPDAGLLPELARAHVERRQADGGHLILANFGTGKSHLALHLFLRQCARFEQRPATERMPVLMPLRELRLNESVAAQIHRYLSAEFQLAFQSGADAAALLGQGRFLLIFDGLDEIAAMVAPQALPTIKHLAAAAGRSPWIVTSRWGPLLPARDEVLRSGSPWEAIELRPWAYEQWLAYLDACVGLRIFDPDPLLDPVDATAPHLRARFEQRVDADDTRALVTTPLFARLLVIMWRDILDAPGPVRRSDLYWRYTRTVLTTRHSDLSLDDRMKCLESASIFFAREHVSDCTSEELEKVAAQYIPNAGYDGIKHIAASLRDHSLLIADDSGRLRFPHKSFSDHSLARALAREIIGQGWTSVALMQDRRLDASVFAFLVELLPIALLQQLTALLAAPIARDILRRNLLEAAAAARVSLRGAILSRLELAGLNLDGCDLRGAELDEITGWNTTFRGADLTGASLLHTSFHHCDFSNAIWDEADVRWAEFDRCEGAP